MEQFYQRRSLNQVVFGDNIPDNVFEASKVTALQLEDYEYLKVMVTTKDDLDAKYAMFIDGLNFEPEPIVLEKNTDLNLVQFAAISLKTPKIDPVLYHRVIESHAENVGIEVAKCLKYFDALRVRLSESDVGVPAGHTQ